MGWETRLQARLGELGWSVAEFARRADIPYDRATKYVHGAVQQPRGDTMERIASTLGISRLYLQFGVDDSKSISEGSKTRRVPIISLGELARMSLAGGATQTIDVPGNSLPVPDAGVSVSAQIIPIEDDSNAPDLEPGDYVVNEPHLPPLPGKFVVARVGQAVFIRLYSEADPGALFVLEPANTHFRKIIVRSGDDYKILGRITHRFQSL